MRYSYGTSPVPHFILREADAKVLQPQQLGSSPPNQADPVNGVTPGEQTFLPRTQVLSRNP